jgi:ubiquinone biosynthesis protein Coq4
MDTRTRWHARVRALGLLIAPGSASQPADLEALLGPRAFEQLFRRFVAHPDGQMLLAERPHLAEALSDLSACEELSELPAGSLGRACAGSVAVHPRDLRADARLVTAHAWFAARLRALPGLWRILGGFDASPAGAAELLAFCGGALGQPRIAPLLLLAGLGPRRRWWRSQRARLAAWRCGRGAVPLLVIPYEQLLPCSLATVRRSLRIDLGHARASRPLALAPHEIGGTA